MPVSISLGLWMTLLSYAISIPLGIRKAVRDGSRFDVWTSTVIVDWLCHPGLSRRRVHDRAVRRRVVPADLPLARSGVGELVAAALVSEDHRLFLAPRAADVSPWRLSAFATTTFLTKNSFLEEIRKQYVMTAQAKGLTEHQVLYGHVFRNAMLIVIAGFPGAFIGAFFAGSLLIETIFSLEGLGLLGFESLVNRDYPVVFATVYIFSLLGLVINLHLRPDLYVGRSAHRLRDARGVIAAWTRRPTPRSSRRWRPQGVPTRGRGCRPCSGGAGRCSRPTGAASGRCGSFFILFCVSLVRRVHRQRQADPGQI